MPQHANVQMSTSLAYLPKSVMPLTFISLRFFFHIFYIFRKSIKKVQKWVGFLSRHDYR